MDWLNVEVLSLMKVFYLHAYLLRVDQLPDSPSSASINLEVAGWHLNKGIFSIDI